MNHPRLIRSNTRRACLSIAVGLGVALVSCAGRHNASNHDQAVTPPADAPALADARPTNYSGLHNVVTYHDGFYSGSVPEGEEGFETLHHWGIKTIISVDGSVPDVDMAKAHGLRYIHLPIGYNGFDEQRRVEIIRATRDALAEGPVYIHCHHGKHRSAGAAAAVAVGLGWMSTDEAVERMHVSGTSPAYLGLFSCVEEGTRLDDETLDRVDANFPEVSRPDDVVAAMVVIDNAFEHLKAIEAAGWSVPKDHPDLVPAAEAGQLADAFRVLTTERHTTERPKEYLDWITLSQTLGSAIEEQLADGTMNRESLSAKMKTLGTTCKSCHTAYRDQRATKTW
ncbi:MAG: hypothetical protein AB7Q00_00780 [Phycisphaerales bacterium]